MRDTMKTFTKLTIVAILLLSCIVGVSATPAAIHQCSVSIERVTPGSLILELHSTSQSTRYSIDVNYASAPCYAWDGHEKNWIKRVTLEPGFYVLAWAEFYDENPELGAEACINWTCQPEVTAIYWSQDSQVVLGYLFLPFVAGTGN